MRVESIYVFYGTPLLPAHRLRAYAVVALIVYNTIVSVRRLKDFLRDIFADI